MLKKERKENEKNKMDDDYDNILCLNYIKINNKSKIEGLEEETQNQLLMDLINSISVDKEGNVGKELNKFFNIILPENKDGDVLKVNYSLSKKINKNTKLKKDEIKKLHVDNMTQIMNSKISQNFVLTREMNEILSVILSEIFKKIKKKDKFKKNEDLIKYIEEKSNKISGILEKYKDKNEMSPSSFIYMENMEDNNDTTSNNNFLFSNDTTQESSSRISSVINNANEFSKSIYLDKNINNRYCFRELKTTKPLDIPLEVLILREKFEKVKKLKLILKRNNNNIDNEFFLEQKDIINNIFILFNLKWLFPNLFEIELDLTNENILKDEIKSNNDKYYQFLKKTKKNKKTTYFQSEYKSRIYDIHRRTVFNERNINLLDDFELLSGSFSIISSIKDNKDDEVKKQEIFLDRYMPSLEMIIIYWYFISTIDSIKTCNFTIPINLEDKILLMLKEKKIYLFEFNILSNINTDKTLEITLDFNSLDNKLFQQVLNLLFKSNKMKNCRLSFFPPEEYFEPQILLNLLLNSDNNRGSHYINAIRTSEDIDLFILRKLSEFFEININKFFIFLINRPNLNEISLIFDIPGILNRVDYYELILIKFIINMLIYLDMNTARILLKSFTILAENLPFDNRKNPFLNHSFNNINIYKKKDLYLEKLTLKFKMYRIKNIYKIIPYHIVYLSIGSFDIETLEYFVEYITSSEYNLHSKIRSLQITLGNTILHIKQCFDILVTLLVECPKSLEEISIYTNLKAKYSHIKHLLEKTNYNKIKNIFIQFNERSLEDHDLKKKLNKKNQLKENRDYNFMDLYYIKRNDQSKNRLLNIMYNIGKKYNKQFMDYNIFLDIEKFMNEKGKKQNIIQYKNRLYY